MSFTASSNGGEYVHSLEIAEMPKHNHTEALYFLGNGSTREIGSFTDKNEGGYKIPNLTWGARLQFHNQPATLEVENRIITYNHTLLYIFGNVLVNSSPKINNDIRLNVIVTSTSSFI